MSVGVSRGFESVVGRANVKDRDRTLETRGERISRGVELARAIGELCAADCGAQNVTHARYSSRSL